MNKYKLYEIFKSELSRKCLSSKEYETEIKKIAKKLKL